jgi:hypothetical protein
MGLRLAKRQVGLRPLPTPAPEHVRAVVQQGVAREPPLPPLRPEDGVAGHALDLLGRPQRADADDEVAPHLRARLRGDSRPDPRHVAARIKHRHGGGGV